MIFVGGAAIMPAPASGAGACGGVIAYNRRLIHGARAVLPTARGVFVFVDRRRRAALDHDQLRDGLSGVGGDRHALVVVALVAGGVVDMKPRVVMRRHRAPEVSSISRPVAQHKPEPVTARGDRKGFVDLAGAREVLKHANLGGEYALTY